MSNWFATLVAPGLVLRASELETENRTLSKRVCELEEELERLVDTQHRAIRRLFLLPKVLGRVLQASSVSEAAEPGTRSVSYNILGEDGPWLKVVISPYDSTVRVEDASGAQESLDFELRNDGMGDVHASMLRELVGYGQFAKRNAEKGVGVMVDEINTELAGSPSS